MEQTVQIDKIKIVTWLLGFYLLLSPLDFLPVIPGVSLSRLLIFIPLAGSMFYIRSMKFEFDSLFIFSVLYIVVLMVSIFYSFDVQDTMQRIITIAMNIGVLLVLSMVSFCQREINLLKKAIVYSGWLTLLLMVVYAQVDVFGGLRLTVVVNGVYQDPNYLTGFIIFPALYYYHDFIENKKKFSLLKMLVFLVFVLLTGSRGGLLALAGAIFLLTFSWMIEKGVQGSAILKIIGTLIVFISAFFIASQVLPEDIVSRFTLSSVLESGGSGRTVIWSTAITSYSGFSTFHKIFGYGAGTITYFTDGIVAHNLWLESLLEIGIVGTIFFIIFYLVFLKKAFQIKDHVITASFFGYIIMSMSLSLYSFKPIWNIMLFILILKNMESSSID